MFNIISNPKLLKPKNLFNSFTMIKKNLWKA